MTSLRIPTPHRRPLERVASLTTDEFDLLVQCLTPDSLDLSRTEISQSVEKNLTFDDPATTIDAIIGAWAFGRTGGLTTEETAARVAESETLDLPDPARATLLSRLQSIFSCEAIDLFAQAASLASEEDRVYCESQSFTDLRPLFTEGVETDVRAAMIRHSLNIKIHVEDRIETIALSADRRSLIELSETIDRALRKGESLLEIAQKAGIRVIDLERGH